MGASSFSVFAVGSTAKEAFKLACDEARYDYGHAGYTGTIAEKDSFVRIASCPTMEEAFNLADDILDEGDSRIDDKWGPAGCITVESGGFVFFGMASS